MPRRPRSIRAPRTVHGEERSHPNHGARGRFIPGNRAAAARGPGNAELRAALIAATSPADVRAVWRRLIALARKGNVPAIGVFLDRVFGRAPQSVHAHLDVHDITPNFDPALLRP